MQALSFPNLSRSQRTILEAIAEFARQGLTPTVPELVEQLGKAGESSLTPTLAMMERKGFLTIQGRGARRVRTIVLTDCGLVETGVGFPVLGAIPAGPVEEAVQEWQDVLHVGNALRGQRGDFFLIARGDSMVGDGILSGDKVLLRPEVQVQNGEIAAVQIRRDGGVYESTLKHIHFRQGSRKVRLKASNAAYADLVVDAEEVSIAGVYRGLLRDLKHKRE